MKPAQQELVVMGRIIGIYGVRGWVKIWSDTEPRGNLLKYRHWRLRTREGWREVDVVAGRTQGKNVIARLDGCDDREQARTYLDAEIAVPREELPELDAGDYYWYQLVGLKVLNLDGHELGTVDHLLETGAHDVLVVRGDRERLIPYVDQTVREVDLGAGTVRVDWDADF